MKFRELVQALGSAIVTSSLVDSPDRDPDLQGVAALEEAEPGSLSYVESEKYAPLISTTKASTLILPAKPEIQAQADAQGIAWIASAYPKLTFAQAVKLFYQPFKPASEIHPTAVIHPTATVGERAAIGAHVVIQAGVKLGNDVCIHPNVVIYPEVQIGDRSLLHANCTIHERVQIGADCVIHSGAVIGAEGFGFVPTQTGWFKLEQTGYVVLEEGVEVGCNSAIDRPAVGETRVGRYTKIDNMVHIAHGCKVGQACAMAAQVGIAGGVTLGNRVILAGQVGIANQAKIGDGAIASAQAGIHGNVDAGAVVSGSPAVDNKIYLKSSAIYSRLSEMYQSIRRIKRQLGDKD